MVPLIQFVLAVCALIVALTAGLGRRALAPLWMAVVLLALAELLPFAVSMMVR